VPRCADLDATFARRNPIEGALHALALHVAIRDGSAEVTATPNGQAPVRFVLVRTTSAQAATFEAPPAAWRVADGATAVLHR
jgi:hypothetical protein